MAKKLSPLEVLALNDLPDEARLKRMAYLVRRHRMVRRGEKFTQAKAKEIIDQFGEPRGRKTLLKKELIKEYNSQYWKWRERRHRASGNTNDVNSAHNYDPVAFRGFYPTGRTKFSRTRAICLSRFQSAFSDEMVLIKKRRHAGVVTPISERIVPSNGFYWPGAVDSENFDDARICGGGVYLLTYRPTIVYVNNARLWEHKIRFLLIKAGHVVKSVRIPNWARSIDDAINNLKTSHAKKAEKRGDLIEIDWEKECWLVRNPKRKKWREIPFKRHTRDRKPKVEAK